MNRGIQWAAGLFEGEGSFTLQKKRRNSGRVWAALVMAVGSTDREVLVEFQKIVGEGNITEVGVLSGRKPMYRWQVSGSGAERAAAMLKPYLFSRRQARLEEQLKEVEAGKPPQARYQA